MALSLYRRHRRDCKAGHPEDSTSSEFDERKKGRKRCECPIFGSGTLDRKFRRQSTGHWEWDSAKAIAEAWQKAGSWNPQNSLERPVVTAGFTLDATQKATIERACQGFLAEFQNSAAFATLKKYRLLLRKLKTFSDDRGYVMIDQWGPPVVRDFRSTWAVSLQTAVKYMSILRSFFEYCLSNEWMERNPARMVKNPKGRDAGDRRNEQKLPFTDEEIQRMYEACPRYGAEPHFKWTGEDLADFISLSIYTGLRISDVALFRADRMQPTGEILVRTTKAGTHVYTWVPSWLQDRISARVKVHGPCIFGEHTTNHLDVITDLWRRKLKVLWNLCGPWKVKPTPHRFRHTFARIVLQRGVSVRDVADLLGNSEQMVRKHYSAWMPERQKRLTKILQEAFDGKPQPELVSIR